LTKDPNNLPFWEHLEELRWRLLKCISAIVLAAFGTYIYSDLLIDTLIKPTENLSIGLNLQVLKVTSMFTIKLGLAIMGGIMFSIPVLIYQTWRFLAPAIENFGAITFIGVILFSSFFFFTGIFFAYKIIIPYSLTFFTSISFTDIPVNYNFTLDGYLNYTLWLLFACGLIFQLPVITLFFAKTGLLTPAFLRHYRKYMFIFFLILAGILTPPDPVSQVLIVIPLVLLYELSIFIAWTVNRKQINESP